MQRIEPLSASSCRVEFTAGASLRGKIEQARDLSSHALPSGDLPALVERAFDALILAETKRRMGADKPRKRPACKPGSRHVPVEVARAVWARDGSQCTFVDDHGRRCSEKRFLTLEHRKPFACGGPATVENLCLLCAPHNAHAARQVFGEAHVTEKRIEADTYKKTLAALVSLGFERRAARLALEALRAQAQEAEPEVEPALRAALALLVK
jgi:5-methylcytosine-specific restriction endonuclease McrA